MEIRQLKYFVQIVEHGSLTRAAEALFIAQPALSQQMAGLEADLGVKLLSRSVHGVRPTDAGNAFYKQANIILKQIEAARHVVREAREQPSGAVSVGLPTSTAAVLAVPFMTRVREQYPNVQIEFHESASAYLTELVINGRIDIGLLFRSTSIKGLKFKKLLTENLFLVGAPGVLSRGDTATLREVARQPLMLSSRPNSIRTQLEEAFSRAHLPHELISEINSTTVLKGMCEARLGCSILPWSAIDAEVASGALEAKRIVRPELVRTVAICVSDTLPMSFAAECVHELMITTISELVANGRWRGVQLHD